ncbi:MAG: hypothetical protein JNM07_09280 [Phycisphaerae bacterium]|nr:hypothetical protein [Phycisphaerae bacterium]
MIARLSGTLESVEGLVAVIRPGSADNPDSGLAYEVMLPAYLASRVSASLGQRVSLFTMQYLESQGQGASFIPRLIGFSSPEERRFFELFTTVKGLGNKRALRALAEPPPVVAGAIESRDQTALQRLPEIGKKLAETIIVELKGKAALFIIPGATDRGTREAAEPDARSGPAEEAIAALIALGEDAGEAQRMVRRAVSGAPEAASAEAILAAAYRLKR